MSFKKGLIIYVILMAIMLICYVLLMTRGLA